MTASSFAHQLFYLEPVFCAAVLLALFRSGSVKKFPTLAALLAVRFLSGTACLAFVGLSGKGIEKHLAYKLYFYTYWPSYAIEAILSLAVIYSIFKLAMAPLKGLATLGVLVFRWAAAISITISIGMAMGPHFSGLTFLINLVTQLQQTSSILTLCLLLFVCFAIRPMGLTFQSRIFGISLGLGIMATTNLVDLAWLSHNAYLFSIANVTRGVAACLSMFIWSAYFAIPEPKRRLIVLPTTSPFLRWNQISMALGDDPGFVAVGGVPPEIFAPAEIEIMRRASVKMSSTPAQSEPGLLSRLA
ncbi:hypothetical protein [Granulicella sp. dw_53]|uniref:hypothetical protein n=1 Tax=Granulicella sp. dw_53 TaxID=2719792 RepID=UPI001BD3857C|nr:hypothetical protein [Granulicella sp. dw_53]